MENNELFENDNFPENNEAPKNAGVTAGKLFAIILAALVLCSFIVCGITAGVKRHAKKQLKIAESTPLYTIGSQQISQEFFDEVCDYLLSGDNLTELLDKYPEDNALESLLKEQAVEITAEYAILADYALENNINAENIDEWSLQTAALAKLYENTTADEATKYIVYSENEEDFAKITGTCTLVGEDNENPTEIVLDRDNFKKYPELFEQAKTAEIGKKIQFDTEKGTFLLEITERSLYDEVKDSAELEQKTKAYLAEQYIENEKNSGKYDTATALEKAQALDISAKIKERRVKE